MEKYLDLRKSNDLEEIKEAAEIIKNGGIVIFPTETVYGIGVNGLNENAIKKLYKIKNRPLNKPISLLVSDLKMIARVAENISETENKLIKAFFPGPLTIILRKKECVPDILTANGNTVGIRMPEGKIARKLVEYAGVPIAATSANISGEENLIDFESIFKEFQNKVDCFIDGEECKSGIGSTIVKITNGVPEILRRGTISKDEIYKIINM